MKASDVMVSNVITVGPDATVSEVADLLLRHRISAVPVVAASGEILGIVSEGDLINRPETQTSHGKSWWLEALASNEVLAAEYVEVPFAQGRRCYDLRRGLRRARHLGRGGGGAPRKESHQARPDR